MPGLGLVSGILTLRAYVLLLHYKCQCQDQNFFPPREIIDLLI